MLVCYVHVNMEKLKTKQFGTVGAYTMPKNVYK